MKFNRLYTLLAGAALTVAVSGGYVHYKWQQVETLTNKGPTRLFTVEKGAHAARLITELGEGETSPWAVRLWLRGHPELVAIKSGTYEIKEGAPLKDTLSLFASGKEFHFSLTFVEGSRFEDWQKQLSSAPYLERLTVEQSEADLAQELGIENGKLEGWFLPETYAYTTHASDLSLLRRAHQDMETFLQQSWEKRQANLPYKTPYEALIMASIIEKETGQPDERAQIAAVFVNRLRLGMKLQTDPTVIYGVKDRYDGNIRRSDLTDKNPYNTYVIDGLPPTPIAMPGKASIEAALNPLASDYLYFVAKGGGAHYFSKTLDEHNRAVREFILKKP
ncbi:MULTISPECIES: endolytic transglycosylase MltG [Aeromonas]|uniref:Endolytic murein transglycosylase n=1 Tax=Aeromonas sobria TaxID=646 RepID=A0A2N3IRM6_AERSO|nr:MULTISPECIES: endolytic transglycosylase MltG [Aeromonas]EKP0262601.1 endolytic transglycosylase MltG [Aeromonas sobria]ELM3617682.1 endolytic transglycosylase MltG [Aeromonas sobria]MCX7129754.1 endolytic transglycosylase MltG [Aeromonas sp.]PKQ74323.1 ABC transporter substrate-binding protein [Aeromonas sobria]HEH9400052.1 endolytic transglycosylase MltG [Aeromonas sobria]